MEDAKQNMTNQAHEASQRLDSLAAYTIERVHRSMEATRSEAVDRFVSRLREQIAPMFAEAKETLQTLAASETAFKNESHVIYARLETQIESSANACLAKLRDELNKNSTAVAANTTETLLKLSQDLEKATRDNLQSLLASMGSHVTATVQARTAEISREFSTGLEAQTRSYLEFIAKSIAEIAKNTPGH
jgi:exonuclease VII large subunit